MGHGSSLVQNNETVYTRLHDSLLLFMSTSFFLMLFVLCFKVPVNKKDTDPHKQHISTTKI